MYFSPDYSTEKNDLGQPEALTSTLYMYGNVCECATNINGSLTALCAASQLPGEGPTDVEVSSIPSSGYVPFYNKYKCIYVGRYWITLRQAVFAALLTYFESKSSFTTCIGCSMFCVGYGIYTKERSSRVYIS